MLVKAIDINKKQTFIEVDPDLLFSAYLKVPQKSIYSDFSFDLFDSKTTYTLWKKIILSDGSFYYEQQCN